MVAGQAGPPGRVAAGVGLFIGAHLGVVLGGIGGTVAYLPFMKQTGGGWDVLIGSFFGFIVGMVVGGAVGTLLALRLRRHAAASRTAIVAGVLVLLGLGPFFLSWWVGSDRSWSGWWYAASFELPIILSAVFVRRLSGAADAAPTARDAQVSGAE